MMSNLTNVVVPGFLAQVDATVGDSTSVLVEHLIAAVVFSALGIIVLAICFWLMEKLTPFSMVKEIEEDENVALGIVVGAAVIGISLIIAAAIHG
jgi:putative membrane protein